MRARIEALIKRMQPKLCKLTGKHVEGERVGPRSGYRRCPRCGLLFRVQTFHLVQIERQLKPWERMEIEDLPAKAETP